MRAEFNFLLTFFHLRANNLGAYSDWSVAGMGQVSANLDAGNTSRRKIHPCHLTGRISPALGAGGSSSCTPALSNYRMKTPRPCRCRMMFTRAYVVAWTGDKMGKGGGDWLGRGQKHLCMQYRVRMIIRVSHHGNDQS